MHSHGRAPAEPHLPQDHVDTVKRLVACLGIARCQIAAAEETIRLRALQGPGRERGSYWVEGGGTTVHTYRIRSPVHRYQRREDVNFFDLLQISQHPRHRLSGSVLYKPHGTPKMLTAALQH
jgi:hypothetical protein